MSREMQVECDIRQVDIRDGRPAMFVIRVDGTMGAERAAQVQHVWAQAWRRAGYQNVPGLLVFADGMTLEAVSDADLRDAGLLRIGVKLDA